jgi:hypothetical protein
MVALYYVTTQVKLEDAALIAGINFHYLLDDYASVVAETCRRHSAYRAGCAGLTSSSADTNPRHCWYWRSTNRIHVCRTPFARCRGLCLQHHFDTFILLAVENLVAARRIV